MKYLLFLTLLMSALFPLSAVAAEGDSTVYVRKSHFGDRWLSNIRIDGESAKKLYYTFKDKYELQVWGCRGMEGEFVFDSVGTPTWNCLKDSKGYFCAQSLYSDMKEYAEAEAWACAQVMVRVGG